MEQEITIFKMNNSLVVMNEHGQKLIVSDPRIINQPEEEIKLFYSKMFNDIQRVANQRKGVK